MSGKTCFFIGNRDTPNSIKEQLDEAIEKHIVEYDVTTFIVGHYGRFDVLVTDALCKAKKKHTNIELYLLEPYALNLTHKRELPSEFNGSFYPEGLETVPKPFAIIKANRYVIQHSDYLIAYCHYIGNTKNFVKYAQRFEEKGLMKITLL